MAARLGVNRDHLQRVVTGKVASPRLLQRYLQLVSEPEPSKYHALEH